MFFSISGKYLKHSQHTPSSQSQSPPWWSWSWSQRSSRLESRALSSADGCSFWNSRRNDLRTLRHHWRQVLMVTLLLAPQANDTALCASFDVTSRFKGSNAITWRFSVVNEKFSNLIQWWLCSHGIFWSGGPGTILTPPLEKDCLAFQ